MWQLTRTKLLCLLTNAFLNTQNEQLRGVKKDKNSHLEPIMSVNIFVSIKYLKRARKSWTVKAPAAAHSMHAMGQKCFNSFLLERWPVELRVLLWESNYVPTSSHCFWVSIAVTLSSSLLYCALLSNDMLWGTAQALINSEVHLLVPTVESNAEGA